MILLNINKFIEDNELEPITTSKLDISGKINNSLFAENIFGIRNSKKWRHQFAYINLNTKIFHPEIYRLINKSATNLIRFINGKIGIENMTMVAPPNLHNPDHKWGLAYLIDHFDEVTHILIQNKLLQSSTIQDVIAYVHKYPDLALIDKFLVIPPIYRDYHIQTRGQIEYDEINLIYSRLINISKSIISLPRESTEYTITLKNLQETALQIFDELLNRLKGKQGLIRRNVLGRTLDFSGRAVITVNSNQRPDMIGLPFIIAVTLFTPFLLHELLKPTYKQKLQELGIAQNVLDINLFLKDAAQNNITQQQKEFLLKVLPIVIDDRVVLAKRDPALHRWSVQAFKPYIAPGDSIVIAPAITGSFNADFDGDQMAVYLPLTDDGQKEAKEKLLVTNQLLSPRNVYNMQLSKDIIQGLNLLTKDEPKGTPHNIVINSGNITELLTKGNWSMAVKYNNHITTLGRAIIEFLTNNKFKVDEPITKNNINKFLSVIYSNFNNTQVLQVITDVTKYSTIANTINGKTTSIPDYSLPNHLREEKEHLFEQFASNKISRQQLDEAINKLTEQYLDIKRKEGSLVAELIDSGARGNKTQIRQVVVSKAFIRDALGNEYGPIKNSMADGLYPDEYIYASTGGRAGIIDRAINTAKTGYFARQLVLACSTIKYDKRASYRSNKYLTLNLTEDLFKALQNRQLANGRLVTKSDIGKTVQIKSPIYNGSVYISPEALPTEYSKFINTTNIGVIAAQTIGERCTQTMLTTFHTAGATSTKDISDDELVLQKLKLQGDGSITARDNITIIIDTASIKGDITGEFIINSFYIDDELVTTNVDITVDISQLANYRLTERRLIIKLLKGDLFGTIVMESSTSYIESANKLLNSKSQPVELLLSLFNLFYPVTKLPLWPFEIVVSQLARDPDNLSIPYRLGSMRKEPVMITLKQVLFYDTGLGAILFENISSVIDNAVKLSASGKFKPQTKSVIQQLLHI